MGTSVGFSGALHHVGSSVGISVGTSVDALQDGPHPEEEGLRTGPLVEELQRPRDLDGGDHDASLSSSEEDLPALKALADSPLLILPPL